MVATLALVDGGLVGAGLLAEASTIRVCSTNSGGDGSGDVPGDGEGTVAS